MRRFCFVALVLAALIPLLDACAVMHENRPVSAIIADKIRQKSDTNILKISNRQSVRAQLSLVPVRYGSLSNEQEFSSVVEAPSDEVGIVTAQLTGVVTRVLVDVGDSVKKGQVLLYINSPDLPDAEATYYHALSKLEEVRAESALIATRLQLVHKEVQRLTELVAEGIAAKKDLESAQARVAGTSAELVAADSAAKAAQAQLRAARMKLAVFGISEPRSNPNEFSSELPVCSPSTGIVIQRTAFSGQSVGPSLPANQASGTKPLISIAKLSKVWVMLEVPQSEISALKLGSAVKFRTELAPGKTFSGQITRLGENIDPLNHCVQVRTEIANSGGILKPGTLVIATAFANRSATGWILPKTAIQDIDGQKVVFKQDAENCYRKIPIRILSESAKDFLFEGAISLGASVVDRGAFFLKTEVVKSSMGAEQ